MKKITGREIALSGITAAFAVIAVVLSYYLNVLSVTFLAVASVVLTLPMMAGSARGSILAYAAAAGLSFIFVSYIAALPFVIIFGPYPILDYFLRKYLKKRVIVLPIEIAFANLSFLGCYFAIGLSRADFPFLENLPVWQQYFCIFLGLTIVFVIFHFAFTSLYDTLNRRLSKVLKQ